MKKKTVFAYLNGEYLGDVVLMALSNNIMLSDMKNQLMAENPGQDVTFKVVTGYTE